MSISLTQLIWQCRRGMLELDHILMRFIKQHEHDLTAIEQALLSQLLHYTDQELYQYLVKHKPVATPELQALVEWIKHDNILPSSF